MQTVAVLRAMAPAVSLLLVPITSACIAPGGDCSESLTSRVEALRVEVPSPEGATTTRETPASCDDKSGVASGQTEFVATDAAKAGQDLAGNLARIGWTPRTPTCLERTESGRRMFAVVGVRNDGTGRIVLSVFAHGDRDADECALRQPTS